MQRVSTTGNATLIAYDDKPIIATDPWFGDEEAAYFGSWSLSHKIPQALKDDIRKSEYIFFTHGHPDHLNPESIQRFRGNKILLPDHLNARIFKDLSPAGYDLTILPDRKWVPLSKNIKIQCITTRIQDSILLLDVCGKLFINLNDAGTRDCSRYIRGISKDYKHSYILALTGYGDADMINFYAEDGSFILPRAASKPSVGLQLNNLSKATGGKAAIPFSSSHQYQRQDSIWAQAYTTPVEAFDDGRAAGVACLPAFASVDCRTLAVDSYPHEVHTAPVRRPEDFGDNWSDQLDKDDHKAIAEYFSRKDRVLDYFGFVNFEVGGKSYASKMRGPKERGITFAVPRNSLMTCIRYRIFDDLLIGNFMKTTLHGVKSLNEGQFNYNVAKYGDNGMVETDEEVRKYLAEYRRRAGLDYLVSTLEDKSRDFLMRFAMQDSAIYKIVKSIYISHLR